MTATDELRRLLDERGVEWTEVDKHTVWWGESTHHQASAYSSILFGESERVHLSAMVTPEQAIAATLGAGTCHDEGDPNDFCCSECGVRMFTESNDTYTMIAADGRTIIKHPNFCPNCGAKIVGPTTNDVDGEVVE